MKDASYILGIEIHRDRSKRLLGLSQKIYITRILKRFEMSSCSSSEVSIAKDDKFSKFQYPRNEIERNHMRKIPYTSAVDNLMYVQVYTHPNISFILRILSKYQSDPSMDH